MPTESCWEKTVGGAAWGTNPRQVWLPAGPRQATIHDFISGHELRAIQSRRREHFGGSALAFITRLDTELRAVCPYD
jgi:hypothetical protein